MGNPKLLQSLHLELNAEWPLHGFVVDPRTKLERELEEVTFCVSWRLLLGNGWGKEGYSSLVHGVKCELAVYLL